MFGADDGRGPTSHESIDPFTYHPLNLSGQSICLLHILPDLSEDGYIKYSVHHFLTSETYVCLSYVWNDPPRPENRFDQRQDLSHTGESVPLLMHGVSQRGKEYGRPTPLRYIPTHLDRCPTHRPTAFTRFSPSPLHKPKSTSIEESALYPSCIDCCVLIPTHLVLELYQLQSGLWTSGPRNLACEGMILDINSSISPTAHGLNSTCIT